MTITPLWRCTDEELRDWYAKSRLSTSSRSPESLSLKEWIEFRDRDWSRHQEAMKRSGAILAWCGYEVPVKELRLATPQSGLGSDERLCFTEQPHLETLPFLDLCFYLQDVIRYFVPAHFSAIGGCDECPKGFPRMGPFVTEQ